MTPQVIYASVSDEYTDALVVNGRQINTDDNCAMLADELADALGVPMVAVCVTMADVGACRGDVARAAVAQAAKMGLVQTA